MSKQGFEIARSLIRAKRYEQARGVLEEMGHPKAQDWIWKVDELEGRRNLIRRLRNIGVLVVLILIAGGGLLFVVVSVSRDFDDDIACLSRLREAEWDACKAAGGYTEYMQSRP